MGTRKAPGTLPATYFSRPDFLPTTRWLWNSADLGRFSLCRLASGDLQPATQTGRHQKGTKNQKSQLLNSQKVPAGSTSGAQSQMFSHPKIPAGTTSPAQDLENSKTNISLLQKHSRSRAWRDPLIPPSRFVRFLRRSPHPPKLSLRMAIVEASCLAGYAGRG